MGYKITLNDEVVLSSKAFDDVSIPHMANGYWCPMGVRPGIAQLAVTREQAQVASTLPHSTIKFRNEVFTIDANGNASLAEPATEFAFPYMYLWHSHSISAKAVSLDSPHLATFGDLRCLIYGKQIPAVNVQAALQVGGVTWQDLLFYLWPNCWGPVPLLPSAPPYAPDVRIITHFSDWASALEYFFHQAGCALIFEPRSALFAAVRIGTIPGSPNQGSAVPVYNFDAITKEVAAWIPQYVDAIVRYDDQDDDETPAPYGPGCGITSADDAFVYSPVGGYCGAARVYINDLFEEGTVQGQFAGAVGYHQNTVMFDRLILSSSNSYYGLKQPQYGYALKSVSWSKSGGNTLLSTFHFHAGHARQPLVAQQFFPIERERPVFCQSGSAIGQPGEQCPHAIACLINDGEDIDCGETGGGGSLERNADDLSVYTMALSCGITADVFIQDSTFFIRNCCEQPWLSGNSAICLIVYGDPEPPFTGTVDFDASSKCITRKAGDRNFPNLPAGSKIVVSGADDASNNGTFTVVSATATVICVQEDLVDLVDDDSVQIAFLITVYDVHVLNVQHCTEDVVSDMDVVVEEDVYGNQEVHITETKLQYCLPCVRTDEMENTASIELRNVTAQSVCEALPAGPGFIYKENGICTAVPAEECPQPALAGDMAGAMAMVM